MCIAGHVNYFIHVLLSRCPFIVQDNNLIVSYQSKHFIIKNI